MWQTLVQWIDAYEATGFVLWCLFLLGMCVFWGLLGWLEKKGADIGLYVDPACPLPAERFLPDDGRARSDALVSGEQAMSHVHPVRTRNTGLANSEAILERWERAAFDSLVAARQTKDPSVIACAEAAHREALDAIAIVRGLKKKSA